MFIVVACVITVGLLLFILIVRAKDLPQPEPVSPFQHLDERKAAIYENLRDLQFEYRMGKLSDEDYQKTKIDLQKELATVMAEVEVSRASSSTPLRVLRRVCPARPGPARRPSESPRQRGWRAARRRRAG